MERKRERGEVTDKEKEKKIEEVRDRKKRKSDKKREREKMDSCADETDHNTQTEAFGER